MHVLLADIKSGKQSRKQIVPLALRKLYTYYKRQGHDVEFITEGYPKEIPDVICFSPIFLFKIKQDIDKIIDYRRAYLSSFFRIGGISVSLRKDIFESRLGNRNIEYVEGLDPDLEVCAPEYDEIPAEFNYGFSSRGCINRCAWCVVPKLEGYVRPLVGWQNQIGNHRRFLLMDNNLLACGADHIESVLFEMKERKKLIDFNQGLDCVFFVKNSNVIFPIFEKYRANIDPFRFSWDSKKQDKYVTETISMLNSLKKCATWYVLYGFNDSIEEIHNRLSTLLRSGQHVKLMRYRNLETGAYNFDEAGYYKKLACYIKNRCITGILSSRYKAKETEILVPEDINDFKRMLDIFYTFSRSVDPYGRITATNDDLGKMSRILQGSDEHFDPFARPVVEEKVIDYDTDW